MALFLRFRGAEGRGPVRWLARHPRLNGRPPRSENLMLAFAPMQYAIWYAAFNEFTFNFVYMHRAANGLDKTSFNFI